MGPMELADYVGLDTTKFIIDGMFCSTSKVRRKCFSSLRILFKLCHVVALKSL